VNRGERPGTGAFRARAWLREHPGRYYQIKAIARACGTTEGAVSQAMGDVMRDPASGFYRGKSGMYLYLPPAGKAAAPAAQAEPPPPARPSASTAPAGEFLHLDDRVLGIRHPDGQVIVAEIRSITR
jgi:hypothetical protein